MLLNPVTLSETIVFESPQLVTKWLSLRTTRMEHLCRLLLAPSVRDHAVSDGLHTSKLRLVFVSVAVRCRNADTSQPPSFITARLKALTLAAINAT